MKRYHVTTLRLPDERSRLGADQGHARVARARGGAVAGGRGRARLQHVHDPREAGHEARRLPGRRRRPQAQNPDLVVAVGGCYAEAQQERIFELYPQVDVAFGPGSIPHLGEWIGAGGEASPRPFRHSRALRRRPADAPRACVQRLGAGVDGLQLQVLVLHRPCGPRTRAEPPARRDRRRGDPPRSRRCQGDHAARPERELVGPRPAPRARHRVRRAAARLRRRRGHRAHPLHEPASEGLPRPRDRGDGRVRRGLRAHPPAAPVGVEPAPEADAPHLRPRAVPDARREAARRDPGPRARHRHHRRLPRRDRGRLPGDARGRGARAVRQRLHVHLLAASRHRGGRAARPDRRRGQARAARAPRRGRAADRAPNGTPSASAPSRRSSSRAPAAPTPRSCAAAPAATSPSSSPATPLQANSSTSRSPAPPRRRSAAPSARRWPHDARSHHRLVRPDRHESGAQAAGRRSRRLRRRQAREHLDGRLPLPAPGPRRATTRRSRAESAASSTRRRISSSIWPRTPRCTARRAAAPRAREHDDDLQRARVLPPAPNCRSSSRRRARCTATSTASRSTARRPPTSPSPRARTRPRRSPARRSFTPTRAATGCKYLVFRFSNVYGRYDNDLQRMVRVHAAVHPLDAPATSRSPSTAARTRCSTSRTSTTAWTASSRGIEALAGGRVANETINLAYGQGNTLVHAAELIAAELGVEPKIRSRRRCSAR